MRKNGFKDEAGLKMLNPHLPVASPSYFQKSERAFKMGSNLGVLYKTQMFHHIYVIPKGTHETQKMGIRYPF